MISQSMQMKLSYLQIFVPLQIYLRPLRLIVFAYLIFSISSPPQGEVGRGCTTTSSNPSTNLHCAESSLRRLTKTARRFLLMAVYRI